MSYRSLMVQLELGRSNVGLLKITADLAQRFDASVIGIAACQPMQLVYGDGYVSGELVEQDREEIDREIVDAEKEFRQVLSARAERLAWHSTVLLGSIADYIVREARAADLVITRLTPEDILQGSRRVNIGDLVMQAGRPVLIVSAAAESLKLDCVLVAWKDSREARRAVFDALPMLKLAARVVVVEVAKEELLAATAKHLDAVVSWLILHGVKAEPLASPSAGEDATCLKDLAKKHGADLVVAGAYGHSRLREWALGGVTRDLMLKAENCSLVSH